MSKAYKSKVSLLTNFSITFDEFSFSLLTSLGIGQEGEPECDSGMEVADGGGRKSVHLFEPRGTRTIGGGDFC